MFKIFIDEWDGDFVLIVELLKLFSYDILVVEYLIIFVDDIIVV